MANVSLCFRFYSLSCILLGFLSHSGILLIMLLSLRAACKFTRIWLVISPFFYSGVLKSLLVFVYPCQ